MGEITFPPPLKRGSPYFNECLREPKSDTQQILEAIAALADGIRARDSQLDAIATLIARSSQQNWDEKLTALSEQVRQGFDALQKHVCQIGACAGDTASETNGLDERLQAIESKLVAAKPAQRKGKKLKHGI